MEVLKRLDNTKLIDVVKNYGYSETIRKEALILLKDRGWSISELEAFGHLNNHNYDDAIKTFDYYRLYMKLGFILLIVSFGLLSPLSFIFAYLAYLSQKQFYRSLGREDESDYLLTFGGALQYFYSRDRMKEQLKGIS